MFFRIGMSYQDTVKDIQQTFGMFPGFFKNTPKDVLPQMWPLFKKYQIGESLSPKKYREMMMFASAAATKCPYCQTYRVISNNFFLYCVFIQFADLVFAFFKVLALRFCFSPTYNRTS